MLLTVVDNQHTRPEIALYNHQMPCLLEVYPQDFSPELARPFRPSASVHFEAARLPLPKPDRQFLPLKNSLHFTFAHKRDVRIAF